MTRTSSKIAWGAAAVLIMALGASHARAYSVLTHEELIDLAWNESIRPFLVAKFPHATENQLREAHAYAYGGSTIQDMGYYPFGKQFFSNLTHYVRTGDFIACLFRNARTMDEYAFAIGALSHYLGDSIGHSVAVNPATAVEFPKLKRKYGRSVTYDESPHGHIRTEFAFDIDELTDAAFAPPNYLEAIGFKVPRKFLEQAFADTYGFDIHEVLGRARPALHSYKTSARRFIPAFAEAEVVLHRHQFPPHPDDETYRIFKNRVAQTNYERHWKHPYHGPGIKAHLLAIVVFLVPKVRGLSDLAIKVPDAQTEEWYLRSVNHTLDSFKDRLNRLEKGPPILANIDLDTGERVKRGDYQLADETYAHLLQRITSKPDRPIPADLKENLMTYYRNSGTVGDPQPVVARELAILKNMKTKPQEARNNSCLPSERLILGYRGTDAFPQAVHNSGSHFFGGNADLSMPCDIGCSDPLLQD